ncbi:MAG: hypothetical protein JJ902_19965 [Roseibium sp.]|nr:hypothetical protein [Roseibium sp.]
MRIGFQAGGINERGMSVALHDYAGGTQAILGHDVVVFYCPQKSHPQGVEKFKLSGLRLVPFDPDADLTAISDPFDLDFCYFITSGEKTRTDIAASRIGVHAVFRQFQPHGDVYAYVSKWLSDWMTGGRAPFVPHIVDLPQPVKTRRAEFGIPENAFVVGRYGGKDQFNIPFAQQAVAEALDKRSNLHFLFVNTDRFIDHPRAVFLPAVIGPQDKADFIATCDAGLNAKKIGESFGLANAEFLALGRPVFTWAGGMDQNHVCLSPDPDWLYKTRRDLVALLTGYEPSAADADKAVSAMCAYRPEAVMAQFNEVFLSGNHRADTLHLPPSFRAARFVQEKYLRVKFRLWKSL